MRAAWLGFRIAVWSVLLSAHVGADSSVAATPVPPSQSLEGVYLQLQFDDRESGWYRHPLEVWFTLERLRIDDFTEVDGRRSHASFFLLPDPEPTFVIFNHAARTRMTCSVARVVASEREAGKMEDWPIGASPSGPLHVLSTGARKTVNSWDAYELQLRKPGPAEERVPTGDGMFAVRTKNLDVAALWFSSAVREPREEISEVLNAVLGPYLAAGGSGIWFHSLYLRTLVALRAHPVDDIPDTLPVQIVVSDSAGQPSAISTLHGLRVGTFDGSVFEPPQGYERSEFPGC